MAYQLVAPPFTKDFAKMTTRELRAVFAWHMEQFPERIRVLENEVRRSRRFRNWRANRSTRSVHILGEWFATQVKTRPYTRAEIAEMKRTMPFVLEDLGSGELTYRTLSLCFDIGAYLGVAIVERYPAIEWGQSVRAKTYIDHGVPILIGFTVPPINPAGFVSVIAYKLAEKETTGRELGRVFDNWVTEAKFASKPR